AQQHPGVRRARPRCRASRRSRRPCNRTCSRSNRSSRRSPTGRLPRSVCAPALEDRQQHLSTSGTSARSTRPASLSAASALIEKYAHLPRCSRSRSPASVSFFRWWLTVGCDSPSAGSNSHAQTSPPREARRLTIRTRAGSPSALNSAAVDSASSVESVAPGSGPQQELRASSVVMGSTDVNIATSVDPSQALLRDDELALHARGLVARDGAVEGVDARRQVLVRDLGDAVLADGLALLRLDALALDRDVVL